MNLLITAALFLTGTAIFAFTGGAILFRSIFIRKPETSSSFKKELPGIPEQFTSHTRDPKIMDVIHEAKHSWNLSDNEQVFIVSRGIRLAGYLHSCEDTRTIALLIHGYSDSAAGLAYLAREYTERNVGVLAIDCRGHGQSGGKTIGMGYADARDLVGWVEFLQKKHGSSVRVILHGISMGAAAVYLYSGLKEAAKKKQYENIVCFIGDSGFSSYGKQMKARIKHVIRGRLQAPVRAVILGGASLICALRCGFFFFQIEPMRAVHKRGKNGFANIPLVIFQGTEDVLVQAEMAEELYAAADGKKKLVLVKEAPHIGSYFYNKEDYVRVIEEAIGLKK